MSRHVIMRKLFIPLLLLGIFYTSSCNKDNGNGTEDGFERKAMLVNYADKLIIPSINQLSTEVNLLDASIKTLAAETTEENLLKAQNAWKAAYISFMYANAYNFGPAGPEGLKKSMIEEIGTFPVSESKINNNIAANNTNFADFNRDNRGFLAIEYLLFSLTDNNAEVLSALTDGENRRIYLLALSDHLKDYVDAVKSGWNTYRETFISNTGTSVGSSTSQLYNEFVMSFESMKNFKLGLPIGKRPGQINTEPTRVEAYYSGISIELMKIHLNAVEDIWNGVGLDGNDGVGFKEYLASVTGGEALITATEAQLLVLKNSLNAVPNTRLSEQVNTNAEQLDGVYVEYQRHTRYFKSDMSSLLGIAITYSSGDGD